MSNKTSTKNRHTLTLIKKLEHCRNIYKYYSCVVCQSGVSRGGTRGAGSGAGAGAGSGLGSVRKC